MSCGVGHRRGSDPALLWLWRGPVATAPIQPLAWEPPYAAGAAQEIATTTTTAAKRQKKTKDKTLAEIMIPIIFDFSPFLGPLLGHMEVPRLGVELQL